MHDVIANPAGSAWSFGGSILTFAFPMILTIVVVAALYILYTKPEVVPGHPVPAVEQPVSYTRFPGEPTAAAERQAAPAETTTAETTTAETTTAETTTAETTTAETTTAETTTAETTAETTTGE